VFLTVVSCCFGRLFERNTSAGNGLVSWHGHRRIEEREFIPFIFLLVVSDFRLRNRPTGEPVKPFADSITRNLPALE
jgi:hypothetical protein